MVLANPVPGPTVEAFNSIVEAAKAQEGKISISQVSRVSIEESVALRKGIDGVEMSMSSVYQERLKYFAQLHDGLIDTVDKLLTLDNARRYLENLKIQSQKYVEWLEGFTDSERVSLMLDRNRYLQSLTIVESLEG